MTAGFLLQATAPGTGQLSLVEPVLVLEWPITLILTSWVFRLSLRWQEWAMAAGLAGLLYALSRPRAGLPSCAGMSG
ncbi:MAG: hypothetical protein ACR2MP_24240 [Streptosporangiaceae bacterium]